MILISSKQVEQDPAIATLSGIIANISGVTGIFYPLSNPSGFIPYNGDITNTTGTPTIDVSNVYSSSAPDIDASSMYGDPDFDTVTADNGFYGDITNTTGSPALDLSNSMGSPYLDLSNSMGSPYLDISNSVGSPFLDVSNTTGNPFLNSNNMTGSPVLDTSNMIGSLSVGVSESNGQFSSYSFTRNATQSEIIYDPFTSGILTTDFELPNTAPIGCTYKLIVNRNVTTLTRAGSLIWGSIPDSLSAGQMIVYQCINGSGFLQI